MSEVTTIGLDIAKHVFQVHGVNGRGGVVLRRRLRRSEVLDFFEGLEPCLVGIEACATGHHWARELLAMGHEVRLMPASYVKPYVKRQKNDAADAEAICEAVTRPTMRFVPIKTVEQQSVLMAHRARELLIRQRTMTINALRAHLAELGIVARKGAAGSQLLMDMVEEEAFVPEAVRCALLPLVRQVEDLDARIAGLDREIARWHRDSEVSQRLATIPGVGPITASAIAATISDASLFRSGRELAAWLGLVPRQNSSGGKERLGRITKKGDPYIRRLLVVGALSAIRVHRKNPQAMPWIGQLCARKPQKLAAVALANKMARIIWALMTSGDRYRAPGAAPA